MTTISLITVTILVLFSSSCTDIDFDSESWKSVENSESDWLVRWDMSDDLILSHGLVGKSKTEIIEMLGEATEKCETNNCDMRFDLGPCRRGISYGTLLITIENGYATNVEKHCG